MSGLDFYCSVVQVAVPRGCFAKRREACAGKEFRPPKNGVEYTPAQ